MWGPLILLNAIGGKHFEKMQFDRIHTIRHRRVLYVTKKKHLVTFYAGSTCKGVTFCKVCRISRGGEESFLNLDNVEPRSGGGSENPCFYRKDGWLLTQT